MIRVDENVVGYSKANGVLLLNLYIPQIKLSRNISIYNLVRKITYSFALLTGLDLLSVRLRIQYSDRSEVMVVAMVVVLAMVVGMIVLLVMVKGVMLVMCVV